MCTAFFAQGVSVIEVEIQDNFWGRREGEEEAVTLQSLFIPAVLLEVILEIIRVVVGILGNDVKSCRVHSLGEFDCLVLLQFLDAQSLA